jgi:(E)-4-hydroxy-3-methylbut-2-enyl-diphosphate synthase
VKNSKIRRHKTSVINVGGAKIGGDNPIAIQSMTKVDTKNVQFVCRQIDELAECGCEIIRVAVPDFESADAISEIKKRAKIPLVADVHFDWRLAVRAIKNGADKIRINPGNIGSFDNIKKVVACAKEYKIPIRIGVNSGSLESDILKSYGGASSDALVESAQRHVKILESLNFSDICVSIKSSDVLICAESYYKLAGKIKYPIHVGVTEAGTVRSGTIKSAVGLGLILSRGIGDTIRVSLTGNPVDEIFVAREILKSLNLRSFGVTVTSCPTCGRTQVDIVKIANEIEKRCAGIRKNIRVAVMGCVVNGPGEAREADVGVAGGNGCGVIFRKGEIIRKVDESEIIGALMAEIDGFC